VSGRGNLSLQMSGAPTPSSLALETELSGFAFADRQGLREGAELDLRCALSSERNHDDWTFSGRCDAGKGLVYVDPLYVEVGDDPLHLAARGQWHASARRLVLERFAYRHPGVLVFHGRAVAAGEEALAVQALRVDLTEASLDGFYPVYVQPLISDGLLELESEGQLAGRLQWRRQGAAQVELQLRDVYVDDAAGRAGLYGLTGTLRWGQGLPAEVSRLRWLGGHVYRAQFGEAELEAAAQGRQVSLIRPADLPVLDGVLHIDDLELDGLGTSQARWRFQGLLSPLSMEAVSQALGWPTLGGTLSGVVPEVTYADGRITVKGALLVRAFDGEIVIHDLSMERPFGLVPKLEAEVDIRNLSLEQLTGAFSFGNIQGRLEGDIRNLRLEDWKPATFDARFYTPPGDASRHRISQRAVENLASLGGAGGALSRTFMRFFKAFSYSRLGLTCRLRHGVCEMDGVAPAEQGYYIVKGSGIPRIDVVGYNRRVDWDTLVHRLKSVTDTAGPVVR